MTMIPNTIICVDEADIETARKNFNEWCGGKYTCSFITEADAKRMSIDDTQFGVNLSRELNRKRY